MDNDTSTTWTLGDEPTDGYVHADTVFGILNSRGIPVEWLFDTSI